MVYMEDASNLEGSSIDDFYFEASHRKLQEKNYSNESILFQSS